MTTQTISTSVEDDERRAYARDYYHRTRERRRELAKGHNVDRAAQATARKRYYAKRDAVIAAAKAVPCADCGREFPSRAMDFHHPDGTEKDFGIGRTRSRSVARLQAEIEKCVVLCAVCHRLRH